MCVLKFKFYYYYVTEFYETWDKRHALRSLMQPGRWTNLSGRNNSSVSEFRVLKITHVLGTIFYNVKNNMSDIPKFFFNFGVSILKSGNACYHSVQNLLCSRLLSKNLNIKIYRIIILPVVLYGCESWSQALREERRLRVF
jgi:hypothetical protein